ncbi:MAG: diaminopimelate epimerase [Bacteroidales bacterium]|nr:diaminopimelate epimerase [Bacteroidales bacterium]
MQTNFFVKSHGLGNDYIVLDAENLSFSLSPELITRLCDVHFGIGSDGILLKVPSEIADFGLRIYNTDASLAENCGNGLRIFSKFLFDYQYTSSKKFTVDIMGRVVNCEIVELFDDKVAKVQVDMGKANFRCSEIPVVFAKEECVNETLSFGDREFPVTCVSMGNPHCVVLRGELNMNEVLTYGTLIETNPMFPQRTNVQFAKIIDRTKVEILIWERGVGHTLASGSSSCAVAAAMLKNNLTDNAVTIQMQGGALSIYIDPEWKVRMTGPVAEIAHGTLSNEILL